MADFWDSIPKSNIGKTTAGGDSDDPVNLGDDSKYQELTGRVENLETSVAEIKDMVQMSYGTCSNHCWKDQSRWLISSMLYMFKS